MHRGVYLNIVGLHRGNGKSRVKKIALRLLPDRFDLTVFATRFNCTAHSLLLKLYCSMLMKIIRNGTTALRKRRNFVSPFSFLWARIPLQFFI